MWLSLNLGVALVMLQHEKIIPVNPKKNTALITGTPRKVPLMCRNPKPYISPYIYIYIYLFIYKTLYSHCLEVQGKYSQITTRVNPIISPLNALI